MKTFQRTRISLVLFVVILLSLSVSLFSCNDENKVHTQPIEFFWDFNSGADGWIGDFAEYPTGEEAIYEMMFRHTQLPDTSGQHVLMLSAVNHDSNLFMFIKKKVSGLEPYAVYYVDFTIEYTCDIPLAQSGDSESKVFLSAGASQSEPFKIAGEGGKYGISIDKSTRLINGDDMYVLGSPIPFEEKSPFEFKFLESVKPLHRVANPEGELWLIIGIESEIDSLNAIYIRTVKVELF